MNIQRHIVPRSKLQPTSFGSVSSMVTYFIFLSLVVVATPAIAQNETQTPSDQYQMERAKCVNGKSNEDSTTCLKEANAAFAANKRGKLTVSDAQYQTNATLRCQTLPTADKIDCERRIRGEGSISGNAETGGIFRELDIQKSITP